MDKHIGCFQITSDQLEDFESFHTVVKNQMHDISEVDYAWFEYAKRIDDAIYLDHFCYRFNVVECEDDDEPHGYVMILQLLDAWQQQQ
jgi:hypothetical protein